MNSKILKKCIDKKELQLSFWEMVTHYWICVFFLVVPITIIVSKIINFIKEEDKSREGEIYMIIIPILLSILFGLLQKRRLSFKVFNIENDRKILNEVVEQTATELGWIIDRRNKNYIKAHTNPGFLSGSWGEQITIIFDGNRILINSICDLDRKTSLVSMGRNKKNEQTFINNVNNANNQIISSISQ